MNAYASYYRLATDSRTGKPRVTPEMIEDAARLHAWALPRRVVYPRLFWLGPAREFPVLRRNHRVQHACLLLELTGMFERTKRKGCTIAWRARP